MLISYEYSGLSTVVDPWNSYWFNNILMQAICDLVNWTNLFAL